MTYAEVRKRLKDKLWRLCNLYSIKCGETGRIIKFVPRPEQIEIFKELIRGQRKIIVLKARRLGFSTAIDVYATDMATFEAGVQISIIDRTQDDATKKLTNICKVAFEAIPAQLRAQIKVVRSNDSSWQLCTVSGDTISAIYAGRNSRGGTNQFLHISEWGVVQAEDAARSEDILTGALPSAEHGTTVIETTWKGGRGGDLWRLVDGADKMPESERTLNDWKVYFFPWYIDPRYCESGTVSAIEPGVLQYLAEKEAELGITFSEGQKCWYARRLASLGMFIFREFPTTRDECFKAPMDGSIYAGEIDKLRSAGAIRNAPVDGSALVHTFWDLGSPRNTVVWYVQFLGPGISIIDVDLSWGDRLLDLTAVQRVARMNAKGYPYGTHFLPHDAAATQKGGKTFQQELAGIGLANTRVIPRTDDVWVGINRLRQMMPRMTFRTPACEPGLEALANYHSRIEAVGVLSKNEPVHDASSHAADALRGMAEAMMHGMIKGDSEMARQSLRTHEPETVRRGPYGSTSGAGRRERVFR